MNLVTNNLSDLRLAEAIINHVATAGPLDGALCHLSVGNIPYDRNTPLATLLTDEGTFPGYASAAVTWDVPGIASDGAIEIIGTVPIFACTGPATPNQIYGLFLTDALSGLLHGVAGFDNPPIPMIDNTGRILVTIRWRPLQGGLVVVVT